MNISRRDTTLDIAKGMSILLMTISHLTLFQRHGNLSYVNLNYLTLFKMPLFIFISGILFSPTTDFKSYLINKFEGLIKPILTIFFAFFIATVSFNVLRLGITFECIKRGIVLFQNLFFPLWFPISLFFATVAFKLFFYQIENKLIKSVFLLFILSFLLLLNYFKIGIGLIRFDNLIYFVYILSLGFLFKKRRLLPWIFKPITFIISVLLFGFCIYFSKELNIAINLYHVKFTSFIPTTVAFLSGISIVLFLSNQLKRFVILNDIFILCSQSAFYILAFHFILGNKILYPIVVRFLGENILSDSISFLLTIFSCIMLYKLTFKIPILTKFILPKKALIKNPD